MMRLVEGRFNAIAVAALIVGPDGRYLMQLRDSKTTIHLPGSWALFGGMMEEGELPEDALCRELVEELDFRPRMFSRFTELSCWVPEPYGRLIHKTFFEVPVTFAEIEAMVQREGQAMELFGADKLASLPNTVPWDVCGVMMHVRREAICLPPEIVAAD